MSQDDVFVAVVASVQYLALAGKAQDAFDKLGDIEKQIQACVCDVIRANVSKLELDSVFEQKNGIAKAVKDELEKAVSVNGFEITQTLIVDVKRAMNKINAAARLREVASEKAQAKKRISDSSTVFHMIDGFGFLVLCH